MTRQVPDHPAEQSMSRLQQLAIGLCIFINAIDGFDVLAMAFTAPSLAKDWNLAPTALGVLFSASLAGMAIGSVAIAPFADRYGRRALLLAGLSIVSLGMFGSAMADDVNMLALTRFITGLGIGGVLPSLNALVAEYANERRRDFAISMMTVGYSVGASIGGVASVYLIAQFGWHSVFVFGGALSALALGAVAVSLPESLDFLLARRPAGALKRANIILARMGRPALPALPVDAEGTARTHSGFASLFSVGQRGATASTCALFFLVMTTFYFLTSWTPKILVDLGLSVTGGISGSVVMSLAGVIGGLVLGALVRRVGLAVIGAVFMTACFMLVWAFGASPVNGGLLIFLAAAIGFTMNGAVVTLYALAPRVFPPTVRASGTGLALGFGRLGATVGPFVASLLIAAGWDRGQFLPVLGLPMLAGAVLLVATRNRSSRSNAAVVRL